MVRFTGALLKKGPVALVLLITLAAGSAFAQNFIITGENELDLLGHAVAAADFDGDGIGDLLIGAYGNDGDAPNSRAYLFYGRRIAPGEPHLSVADADAIFIGPEASAFGYSVASAGDMNSDGFDEVLIGTFANAPPYRAYLFYGGIGNERLSGRIQAEAADVIVTGNDFAGFGRAVSSAGSVNGDDLDDIVIGSNGEGVLVFFGGKDDDLLRGNLQSGDADVKLVGPGLFGTTVAPAGDVDGDGSDDVLVGSPGAGPNAEGQAFIFRGGPQFRGNIAAAAADYVFTGEGPIDMFGHAVASPGDVDNNGISDILIGAAHNPAVFRAAGDRSGHAYLFYGPPKLENAAGDADAIFVGSDDNDFFGNSVAGAGDVDGDGIDDLIIGARNVPPAGAAYVYHGGAGGNRPDGIILAAGADEVFFGEAPGDSFGYAVGSAGDFSADGRANVVVGARENDGDELEGRGNTGRAYVYFGEVPPLVENRRFWLPAALVVGLAVIVLIVGIRRRRRRL